MILKRKSQAALEFIMTYGWAILVVLVAIAALAYFGVLNPSRFLPNKCTLQSGIACLDFKATATALTVVVQNSLGFDITVDCVKAEQCTALGTCVLASGSVTTLANGAPATPITLCCGAGCAPVSAGNSGSKYSGRVNITYTIKDTNEQHTNQGDINTKLE